MDNKIKKTKLEIFFLLFLISSCGTYISFGIYYLNKYFNINRECSSSLIWYYTLFSIIIYPLLYCNYILQNYCTINYTDNLRVLIVSVIFVLILICFGGYSIYDYKEDCEYGDKLWTFSIATIILHIIYIIYGFISYLGYLLPVEIYPLEDLETKPEDLESKPEDLESKPEELEINNIDKDNYLFNLKIAQETEV